MALRVPVTAASAAGTHLETGCRIRPALHTADGYPPLRAPNQPPAVPVKPGSCGWARQAGAVKLGPCAGRPRGPASDTAWRGPADTALTAGPASFPATPAREPETC